MSPCQVVNGGEIRVFKKVASLNPTIGTSIFCKNCIDAWKDQNKIKRGNLLKN